jgi:long-chain acyl-CoA synthetase
MGRYVIKIFVKIIFKVYTAAVRGLRTCLRKAFYHRPEPCELCSAPSIMAAVSWKIGSQTFYLGSSDYFDGPITSRIAKLIQVIPVDMDARLYSALQLSAYVLRQGRILCVFPEGKRARDGKLHEFKKGVGIIARELNVPIVPVAIRGTYEMLAPGKTVPKPAKVTVTFGKPILPGDRHYDGIVKKLYEEVAALLGKGRQREK